MKSVTFSLLFLFLTLQWSELASGQSIKGQSMKMHTFSLNKKKSGHNVKELRPIIGFINRRTIKEADSATVAAFAFLRRTEDYKGEFLTLDKIRMKLIRNYSLLWFYDADTASFNYSEIDPEVIQSLKTYVENGGNVLLSLRAFHLINTLGVEPVIPYDSLKLVIDEGLGRRLGLHAFREHPIFSGLNNGAYIFRPDKDISVPITGYFSGHIPLKGKVIAVDWDYIHLRESSKLILEYSLGKGKIIAVGAYMDFLHPNLNKSHLELFTRNIFDYLNRKLDSQKSFYWDYSPLQVLTCDQTSVQTEEIPINPPNALPWKIPEDSMTLNKRFATDNFWDASGERILCMGSEKGGLEEVWAHPFMAFRDYEVGIRFSSKDSIYWLTYECPDIHVNPAYFMRVYKFPQANLKEIVVTDPVKPSGVIHYEYRGVYAADVFIRFRSDLRWMWPYSEIVTGSICHSWNSDFKSFTIRDKSGDLNVILGGNRKPKSYQSGQFSGFRYEPEVTSFSGIPSEHCEVSCLLQYSMSMNDNLDIAYAATSEGYHETYNAYKQVINEPLRVFEKAYHSVRDLFKNSLIISTPDSNFNLGYCWALVGSNRFFVNTPGMGKSLVAGYSTTRQGWDGGHAISGRPGYSWYFGRDGEWSGFALLDYGDFEKVKDELEFFNKYQDLNGKIFHEATTSGFIHYDAADATPLYIILAGKYFRHSNDTAFLRKTWPNIIKALDFCFSTDTDQDHLIENTNVGHGWVEGGMLYGSHSTIYMAGSWSAALKEAAGMADVIGDPRKDTFEKESKNVRKIINSSFWNENKQLFAYGMNKDGSFRSEPTILPAVPLYFKMADPEKSKLQLYQFAGNAFTTNWGTRIVRDDSPYFKPTGYHYGSVWPLFTGWTSLAEYAYGNYLQGFSHAMNNLNIYKNWGLGFVEEVMNGAEYLPSGVCPHQCWSETMVLQPLIEGMLGLEIFAPQKRIILSPKLPADWDSITVSGIRLADQRLEYRYKRIQGEYNYEFQLSNGSPIDLEFNPLFPAGTLVKNVLVDGSEIPFTVNINNQYVSISVTLNLRTFHQILVQTEFGISVLPVVPDPKPGDPASGTRLLSASLNGNVYSIILEGIPGSSEEVCLYLNTWKIEKVDGASIKGQNGKICRLSVPFGHSGKRYQIENVHVLLK